MPASRDRRSDDIVATLETMPSGTPVAGVARRLMDLFTGGDIAVGTRLPPERQLAATLGVGRSAVREALAALEILGIVDVRPGSGTYLRGTASDLLPDTLRWGLLIGERDTEKLLELRAGLEIYVARLAAENPAAAAELTAALDRMRADAEDLGAFAAADRDFHDAVAAASGNELIVDLLQVTRSLLRVYADRAVTDPAEVHLAIDEHDAIARAIAQGDADAAASAMAVHMTSVAARLGVDG